MEGDIPYYVYENYPNNRPTVHERAYVYCSHGRGLGGIPTWNGRWI